MLTEHNRCPNCDWEAAHRHDEALNQASFCQACSIQWSREDGPPQPGSTLWEPGEQEFYRRVTHTGQCLVGGYGVCPADWGSCQDNCATCLGEVDEA